MTDHPIIFSAPMILALLEGRKTMTRRLVTPTWRRVKPGDRLWVRENFRLRADQDHKPPSEDWWKAGATYAADGSVPTGCGGGPGKLRPCIHMPRWASRLTLTVTATKIEQLHNISHPDAVLEGCDNTFNFLALWLLLHGKESWDANPEVVALTFTVAKANIDANRGPSARSPAHTDP